MVGVLVDQDPALKNAKEEIKIAIGMEGNFVLFSFSIYISNNTIFSCPALTQSIYVMSF